MSEKCKGFTKKGCFCNRTSFFTKGLNIGSDDRLYCHDHISQQSMLDWQREAAITYAKKVSKLKQYGLI